MDKFLILKICEDWILQCESQGKETIAAIQVDREQGFRNALSMRMEVTIILSDIDYID